MRLVLTIPAHGKHAEPQSIPLRQEGIDVGGASDCNAIVDHPSVGTARVRLEPRGGDWVVIDREGRGVCSVGGVPLRAREPRLVRPPHALRLGDVELALALDPLDSHDGATRDVALRAAAFVAEIAPARPRVRVVEGPQLGETLDLAHAGPYRVGRGKSCDLFLDADDASREHFSIACEDGRVVVRDLGSPRGTYLGRSRLAPNRGAVWDPTRMLRAADAVFSLEVATPAGTARLLEPLARIPDASQAAPEVPTDEPAGAAGSEASGPGVPAAAPAASLATTTPTSSPVVALAHALADAPSASKPSRDPRFVIALLAVVLAVAGAAALIALLLS